MTEYSESKRGFGGNMTQKKRKKVTLQPWYCPEHGPQAAYRNQCATCLRPRVNEYDPGTTILPNTP